MDSKSLSPSESLDHKGISQERSPETLLSSLDPTHVEEIIDAYVAHAPISLCIREIHRWIVLQTILRESKIKPKRILDVGCGDGHWWKYGRNTSGKIYGVDINRREIAQARNIINAAVLDVSSEVPFSGIDFDLVVGNCSLEHIPNICATLKNLRKATAESGALVLFVPTPTWAYQGRIQRTLLRRIPRLAMTLSGMLNGFFQHWHLWDAEVWSALLRQHGWAVQDIRNLGNRRSEYAFRLFLFPAFFGFLVKLLTGHYPNRIFRFLPRAFRTPSKHILNWALTPIPSHRDSAYEYAIIAKPIS